ncbi:MAG: FKBP-type peptidyl-prolyl cis-trans isomerase [Gammaproteobacteria bacterium]|nr:FKBP-type peptidyl-prolyl cis-trans isomerase [Gammaproteobacteria bacterium]
MIKLFPVLLGSMGLIASASTFAADSLTSVKDKASYSIGVNLGMQLSQQKDDIDVDKVINGLKDAYAGKKPKLSMEEMKTAIGALQENLQKKQQEQMKSAGDTNKKEGDAFLAANKKKEGVKTLASGLQYKVITEGKGETPRSEDTVVTHYRGNLINGQVFDSSYKRGQPATFPVTGVIKGWTEALQKMKVGSKWQLFIPSDLAYGDRGAGQVIGPNAVLIFEIELLEIKKS